MNIRSFVAHFKANHLHMWHPRHATGRTGRPRQLHVEAIHAFSLGPMGVEVATRLDLGCCGGFLRGFRIGISMGILMAGWCFFSTPLKNMTSSMGGSIPCISCIMAMYLMYYGKWSKSLKPPTRWDLIKYIWMGWDSFCLIICNHLFGNMKNASIHWLTPGPSSPSAEILEILGFPTRCPLCLLGQPW